MSETPSIKSPLPMPHWIRLIGGPRDGVEFQSHSCGAELELSAYTIEKQDERMGIAIAPMIHVYRRRVVYLSKRNGARVLYLNYHHERVKERADAKA